MNKTILCLTLVLITSSACLAKKKGKGKAECKAKAMCQKLKEQETTLVDLTKKVKEQETTLADLIKKVENLEKRPIALAPQRDYFDVSFFGGIEAGGGATADRVVPSLNAFTICMWINASLKAEDPSGFLFYYTSAESVDLAIQYVTAEGHDGLSVYLKGVHIVGMFEQSHFGEWQHVCVTWDNTIGIMKIYRNGVNVSLNSDEEVPKGLVLDSGNNYLGTGHEGDSFTGDINGFNMWDHVLLDAMISRMSVECSLSEGNVLKWSDFKSGVNKPAELVEPSTCSP